MKFAALLSYAGSDYCGWQRQRSADAPELPSIQSTLEAALGQVTQQKISVVGSGRTDSGVHATGQVAHFTIKEKEWDPELLVKALNGTLPPAIRVLQVKPVPLDFHAQRSAAKKQYSFYIQAGPCALPYLKQYTWWIRRKLDVSAMQEGLAMLLGEHDFLPFQASGANVKTTVRELLEAEITRRSWDVPWQESPASLPSGASGFEVLQIRLIGTGFLKQMVRGIAGTLVQIGEGRRPASDMRLILSTKDRKLVGPTAPGRALWLEKVWYPEFDWS